MMILIKKILDINKCIQEHTQKILTIEKAVDINAEQIQYYLKLVDVRKNEIRIELTKSLPELSEQLDQKITGLSQSLRSEITDLVNKQLKDISLIGRVTALEIIEQSCTPSTNTCRPMPVNQLNLNVGLLSTGVESMPAGTPIVTNSATVSTTRVVSCDNPQVSCVSNSIINPVIHPVPWVSLLTIDHFLDWYQMNQTLIQILLVYHLYHIQILIISVVNTLFQIMMNLKAPCQFLTALVTLIPFSQNSKFWLQLVIGLKRKQFVFF